jgi:hypothetical protein
MTGKEVARLAAALLIGAALAFPAGLWLAGESERVAGPRATPPRAKVGRAIYSPSIRDDAYFLDQQRKGIETLKAECRRTGAFCAEARLARRRLEQQAAD